METIDEYIKEYPTNIREVLEQTRKIIHNAAPDAIEKISWRMPTFYQDGNLIHFAAFKNHMGIYPGPDAIVDFANELKDYKTSKGAIQFPYYKEIPYNLIAKIVEYNLINRIKKDK